MMMTSILVFLLSISSTNAQDTPASTALPTKSPTSLVSSPAPTPGPVSSLTSPSPTTVFEGLFGPMPDPVPTSSLSPTVGPTAVKCSNDPEFVFEFWDYLNCTWQYLNLTCDDDRVGCFDYNSFGDAVWTSCCKCKPLCSDECTQWSPFNTAPPGPPYFANEDGIANEDGMDSYDDTGDSPIFVIMFVVLGIIAVLARVYYNNQGERPERRNVQQTMAIRRQEQRESNTTPGLTEEERSNARYEKFVTKFYFQQVMPGMTDITAETLRSTASKPDDEEHPTHAEEEGAISANQPRRSSTMSRRLSSWRKPSATDECVICLEYYQSGETICAPITTECNHVFHEGCIMEWLKTKDHCPLCRVTLLED